MQRLKDSYIGRKVKVIYCWSASPVYSNLKPNTIHTIIPASPGSRNNNSGVWVKGVGDVARLIEGEYKFVTNFIRNAKTK